MTTLDYDSSAVARPGLSLWLRQTAALFADALRRLRAAKLFWVALGLSVLIAAAMGVVGINESGLTILFYGQLDTPFFSTEVISAADFYKGLFVLVGVNVWLAWAAIILAIISTADLVPDLVADGSVDLYVTRPLGRVQLFLTRYATGLLFVAGQAVCFALTALVVFALRGGVWLPGLFWAVPMVVLMFSFLYCVSALVGLLTGSSVAAVLVALLFWMLLFAIDTTEQQFLLRQREQAEAIAETARGRVTQSEALLERLGTAGEVARSAQAGNVEAARERVAQAEATAAQWARAHRVALYVKAPLPKTGETIQAMQNRMFADADLSSFEDQFQRDQIADARRRAERRADELKFEDPEERAAYVDAEVAEARGTFEAAAEYAGRSPWWSIGTSAAFEAGVLLACCWIFARRDL